MPKVVFEIERPSAAKTADAVRNFRSMLGNARQAAAIEMLCPPSPALTDLIALQDAAREEVHRFFFGRGGLTVPASPRSG